MDRIQALEAQIRTLDLKIGELLDEIRAARADAKTTRRLTAELESLEIDASRLRSEAEDQRSEVIKMSKDRNDARNQRYNSSVERSRLVAGELKDLDIIIWKELEKYGLNPNRSLDVCLRLAVPDWRKRRHMRYLLNFSALGEDRLNGIEITYILDYPKSTKKEQDVFVEFSELDDEGWSVAGLGDWMIELYDRKKYNLSMIPESERRSTDVAGRDPLDLNTYNLPI